MNYSADYWIETLNLTPHPEGGHFREIYRSHENLDQSHLPKRYSGPRAFATSIFYLLKKGEKSTLHRIASDELWHFYAGDPLLVHVIEPGGHYHKINLGPDPDQGQTLFGVVHRPAWFGATLNRKSAYALVGCTVAPGFDFQDFEVGNKDKLLKEFPGHQDILAELCR